MKTNEPNLMKPNQHEPHHIESDQIEATRTNLNQTKLEQYESTGSTSNHFGSNHVETQNASHRTDLNNIEATHTHHINCTRALSQIESNRITLNTNTTSNQIQSTQTKRNHIQLHQLNLYNRISSDLLEANPTDSHQMRRNQPKLNKKQQNTHVSNRRESHGINSNWTAPN